ncbi:MAG: signal peptidase I [Patescibacteria group bacterium]|jgi:signal peptidase I
MPQDDNSQKKPEIPFTPSGQHRIDREEGDVLPSFWKSFGSFTIEILKVLIIAAAIVVPVRYFLVQPYYVKGASMEPTFHDNEYLVIDRLSYRLHDVKRGDVVVLSDPRETEEFLIKRVIGLPGEKVEIRGGYVTISNTETPSGFVLDETEYLPSGRTTSGDSVTTLEVDEYFVLGDNRSSSLDSRSFGAAKREDIVGRTWVRAWPLNSFTTFSSPEYGNGQEESAQ